MINLTIYLRISGINIRLTGQKQGYQSFKAKFNGKENIVSIYHLNEYGWNLVSVTDWNSLSQEVTSFAKWFFVIMGLCIVTAIVFNRLFMNRITGTIAVIVRFMRRVEDGDLNARVEEKGEDELLLLSKGFTGRTPARDSINTG